MGGDDLVAIAEALYDFDGLRADNLPFRKGDIITVLDMSDGGWWKGSAGGKVGIFPYNYVELREEVGGSFPIVRALFDFEAMDETQISFEKGEEITLLKEVSVDWWMGKKNDGQEGLFPANRVEKTDMEDTQMAQEEKKRWSRIKKEKKEEMKKAAKERASLDRKKKKQQDEEERKRLEEQAAEAAERARRAEEELARVKAEAALLKQQQKEKESKRSSRARKSLETHKNAVKAKARLSAVRFQGMAPGPPPDIDGEVPKYLSEGPRDDDDDLFGPAPEVEPPKRSVIEETVVPEPKEETPEEPAKPKFKYQSKFANLGGGSKCRSCKKTVGFADRVKALGDDWHKDCFRCATCSMILRQGEWREHNNHPYCQKCHATGFGIKGFGFGGSVVPVDAGKLHGTDAKASSEVDSRPLFSVLGEDKI